MRTCCRNLHWFPKEIATGRPLNIYLTCRPQVLSGFGPLSAVQLYQIRGKVGSRAASRAALYSRVTSLRDGGTPYLSINLSIYLSICLSIYVYIHKNVYTCVYIHIYICVFTYMHMCITTNLQSLQVSKGHVSRFRAVRYEAL